MAAELEKRPALARLLPPEVTLLAAWHNGQRETAFALFSARWRQARDFRWPALSSRLARLEADWRASGHPTREELRDRLRGLARSGRWAQARQLAAGHPRWRKALERWQRLREHPEQLADYKPGAFAPALSPWANEAFAAAIRALSRSDAATAWELLHRRWPGVDSGLVARLARKVARRAARRHEIIAADWLARLPSGQKTNETRAWRVRLLLLDSRWADAARAIRAMPEAQRGQSRWRYWLARCEAESGHPETARNIWRELAKERGYHAFLAASRLGQAPLIQAEPAAAPESAVRALAAQPAIVRAREWLRIGDFERAAREWRLALAGGDREQWLAALTLAQRWRWHDRAIQAAWRAGAVDALDARFPLAFADAVLKEARTHKLPPELVWGVIRQESAFNRRAVSRSGARGLMQLMPATAREVARKLGLALDDAEALFDPALNIALGSAYLAELEARFGQRPALIAAAYNAGPNRVQRWLEAGDKAPALDVWIEAIPYSQTRHYVQQVLAFRTVYEWRLARTKALAPVARAETKQPEG